MMPCLFGQSSQARSLPAGFEERVLFGESLILEEITVSHNSVLIVPEYLLQAAASIQNKRCWC